MFQAPPELSTAIYRLALFLHVFGVILLMGGHTLLHVGLERMRRADRVEQLRDWSAITAGLDRFMPPFTLIVLLPALYMAWTRWGWTTAWIDASLVTFLAMSVLGPILLGRRFAALRRAVEAEPDGLVSATLTARIVSRLLWTIENTFTALLLGMLFLMTVKPNLVGTLLTLAVALLVGLLSTARMGTLTHVEATAPLSLPQQS